MGGSVTMLYYLHDPKNPGGPGKKGDILEGSEPEMYIRGEEKLGGGLSAWFQCTSSFDLWGATGDGFCTRNSALGFKGGFGNIFFGNWDTPQKLVYNQARGAFSGTNALYGGTATLLYGSSASGVGNLGNPERFYRRQARAVNYHSPSWSGFSFKGAYSSGTEHTGLGLSPLQPRLYSLGGEYRSGPLYVGLSYELHQDYNPGSTASTPVLVYTAANAVACNAAPSTCYSGGDDTNWSIVGVYTFGGNLRLSGVYSKSEYEVTNGTSTDVDGFAIYLDWKVAGPHSVRFQYGKVEDPSGNSTVSVGRYIAGSSALDGGSQVIGVNYEYAFSKRTAGLIGYNQVDNDAGARFSLGKSAATLGGKQTAMGIAIKHRF
jgi:predicted porin